MDNYNYTVNNINQENIENSGEDSYSLSENNLNKYILDKDRSSSYEVIIDEDDNEINNSENNEIDDGKTKYYTLPENNYNSYEEQYTKIKEKKKKKPEILKNKIEIDRNEIMDGSYCIYSTQSNEIQSDTQILSEINTINTITEESNDQKTSVINTSNTPEKKKLEEKDYEVYSDWNSQFQNINAIEDQDERNSKLSTITKNFHFEAKKYGEIIISERNLPISKKTIKPVSIGGVAGGEKFIVHGMLFKFAQDIESTPGYFIYGGKQRNDGLAQKSVGLELKAMASLFDVINSTNCNKLRISLACRVDFMGYCLSVQALLPIGNDTLVYGSKDAGKTILSQNEDAKEVMEIIGENLYLQPHYCLDRKKAKHLITGPCDIEVHSSEGYLYAIDVARLFPPDLKKSHPNSIFYQQFRPEFLKWYKIPMSSDAFSSFGSVDSKENNKKLFKASRVLKNERIPKFAKMVSFPTKKDSMKWLSIAMQQRGINVRYMGLVRYHSESDKIKDQCLFEMAFRVIAITIKTLFRDLGEKIGAFKQESYLGIACNFYNNLISPDHEAWKDPSRIKKLITEKFGNKALTEEELNSDYNLLKNLNVYDIFKMLEKKVGISLGSEILERFIVYEKSVLSPSSSSQSSDDFEQSSLVDFEFVLDDFQAMSSSVKGLKLHSMATGDFIRNQALSGKKDSHEKLRLLFRAANLMDEGSRGDLLERLKYIELRLDMAQIVLENTKVFNEKTWKGKLNKHLKFTEQIFKEINNLSEFNEIEIPKKIDFLTVVHNIHQISVFNNENFNAKERIKQITEVYNMIEKLDVDEFPEIKEQIFKLSKIIYDTLGRCSWDFVSVLGDNNIVEEIISLLNNNQILTKIFEINLENAESDHLASVTRILLDLSPFSDKIKDSLIHFFNKSVSLDINKFIPGESTDQEIEKRFSLLKDVSSLEEVSFRGCASKLTDKSIQLFLQCTPKIKRLNLSNYWNLSSQGVIDVSKFNDLSFVSLGPTLVDSISDFTHLKNLETLILKSSPKLTDLPQMASLTTLSIKNCSNLNLEKNISKENFPKLIDFKISLSKISDNDLGIICDHFCDQLESLSLNYCNEITNNGILNVEKMKKLKKFEGRSLEKLNDENKIKWPSSITHIDVRYSSNVGDNFLVLLSKNNNIEYLDLQTTKVTDKALKLVLKNSWETIKVLKIKFCERLTNFSKSKVCFACSNLEKLSVSSIDFHSLSKTNFSKMTSLKIYHSQIEQTDYEKLVPNFSSLNELKLFKCNVNDQVVKLISAHCQNIKKLGLSDTFITDLGCKFISNLHPKLRQINISECTSITEEGIQNMLENEPKINVFTAQKCNSLGNICLDFLQEKCGYSIEKLSTNFMGKTKSKKKDLFFFPNMCYYRGYFEGRVCKSLTKHPKLRKLIITQNTSYNAEMAVLSENKSIEMFESLNGSINQMCSNNPEFLEYWSKKPIAATLRILNLPSTKINENRVVFIKNLTNLVSFPIQNLNVNESVKEDLIKNHLVHVDLSFSLKKSLKRDFSGDYQNLSNNSLLFSQSTARLYENKGLIAVVTHAHFQLQSSIVLKLCNVGYKVFALYKESMLTNEAKQIFDEKFKDKIIPITYDPVDSSSVDEAFENACKLGLTNLNVLILGPYIYFPNSVDFESSVKTTKRELYNECMEQIIFSSLSVLQKFYDLITKTPNSKILFLANRLGSITENSTSKGYSARTTFAGLNQIAKNLSIELDKKVLVNVALPGIIFSGSNARYSDIAEPPFVGAERVFNILEFMNKENTGKLIEHTLQIVDP